MFKSIVDNIDSIASSAGIGSILTLIISNIVQKIMNKRKDKLENVGSEIGNNIQRDTYWENRFNGLKLDFEDREKYHKERYSLLEQTYVDREKFQKDVIDKLKTDYSFLLSEFEKNEKEIEEIKSENLSLKNDIIFKDRELDHKCKICPLNQSKLKKNE